MQTMTQGNDGISLARSVASGFKETARRLALVAAVLSIAALVAGTAGTSYAKSKKAPKVSPEDRALEDTVVVSNFGTLFAGSVETFLAGTLANGEPSKFITGSNTLLGAGNGAAGDAQSSLDGDIAVTVPLGIAHFIPNGFVELYSASSNGNSQPEAIIGSPTGLGAPDLTGLSLPQGVAFENPFDERLAARTSALQLRGSDLIAVSNFTPTVFEPNLGILHLGVCTPNAPGFSLGTVTEYFVDDLESFAPPFNGINDIFPVNNSPVCTSPIHANCILPPVNPNLHNATIGGCDTFLLGPVGLAFDNFGELFVVNEIGKYVTVYAAGASGDAIPIAIVGAPGTPTAGAFVDPLYVTVNEDGDTMYVTDVGDNSIKIFDPFTNCFPMEPCFGSQDGTIQGGNTKLKRPEGIAIFGDFDDLYVVSNNANSLSMFDDFDLSGGNIAPKMIVKGHGSRMNFPVGVALPQFTPPPPS
jgi:hypothetical protein